VFGRKRREQKEVERREQAQADVRAAVVRLIALAQGEGGTDPEWPLLMGSGERLFSTIQGCGLYEPRRGAGHWEGRSAGVSVPTGIMGIRVRLGKSAGTYVQGTEAPTVIDSGNASITSERVVFQGSKYTREWEYSKLIGIVHDAERPATAIQVANRQKTSGIVYPGVTSWEPVRLALTVAVAVFRGEAAETIKELQDELAQLDASAQPNPIQPVSDQAAPPAAREDPATTSSDERASEVGQSTPTPPPMWAADPSGRHQFRYWDGTAWTESVADNGAESKDPLPTGPPEP
jgi:hypothetical protein